MSFYRAGQMPIGHYFPLPNEIFSLGLTAAEIAVYAYLMRCEDRKSYQCHPSYRTIGKALHMSENTVRKYVTSLEQKNFICTEPTRIVTKDGRPRNGSLRYTILPLREAINHYYAGQMETLDIASARQKAAARLNPSSGKAESEVISM